MRVSIVMHVERDGDYRAVDVEADVEPRVAEMKSSEPLLDFEERRARGLLMDRMDEILKGVAQ